VKKGYVVASGPCEHTTLPRGRKALGQHFLVDRNIVHKIVRLAQLQPGETVLEIGPGRGILTEALLDFSGAVIAIEVDSSLYAHLRDKFAKRSGLKLIEGDALDFDYACLPESYLVVANLPYYLSTPLLFRLLKEGARISRMVLMLQAEVAGRLAASPGGKEYGVLSIAAQFRSEVRLAFKVSATCFQPPPRVDSAVVVLTPLLLPRVCVENEGFFFKVVRAGFAHRRKSLANSLRDEGFNPEMTRAALTEAGIDGTRRAETLSIQEFGTLANHLHSVNTG
jgi:16S rRNA (adenine1518-N6/adenine1519-N6)-dimethyltransferase